MTIQRSGYVKSHERLKALNVINHNTYCRQFFQDGKILREALTQKLLGVVIFSYKTCSEHKPLICHPLLVFFSQCDFPSSMGSNFLRTGIFSLKLLLLIIDRLYLINWLHKVLQNSCFLSKLLFLEPLHFKESYLFKADISFRKCYFFRRLYFKEPQFFTANIVFTTALSIYRLVINPINT